MVTKKLSPSLRCADKQNFTNRLGPRRMRSGQRLLAEDEARRYESLSEQQRDAIWNKEADSIEAEAESDKIDLPIK